MINQMSFNRDINELENVFRFIKESLEKLDVTKLNVFELELTAEEIFTNMVRHSTTSDKPINFSIEKHGRTIRLIFSEYTKNPFDLTKVEEIDFDEYIKERKSGGLGLHLVKTYMDEVHFSHSEDVSTTTLIKSL